MKEVIIPAALAALLALVKRAVKTNASMTKERPPSSIMARVTRTSVLGMMMATVRTVMMTTVMVTKTL